MISARLCCYKIMISMYLVVCEYFIRKGYVQYPVTVTKQHVYTDIFGFYVTVC